MPSSHDIDNKEHDEAALAKRVVQVDANGDPVAASAPDLELTASVPSTSMTPVFATQDLTGYRWFSIQAIGGSATCLLEVSNDGTNWQHGVIANATDASVAPTDSFIASTLVFGQVVSKYLRVTGDGTIGAFTLKLRAWSAPGAFPNPSSMTVNQGTNPWSVSGVVGLRDLNDDQVNPATQDTLATRLAEATFTGRIGEVQASPTANTLLARLKDLLTGIVLAAGSAIIGKVGIDQTTPGTTNAVTDVPATSGGWSVFNATSGDNHTALTNSAQVVKASAGQIGGWYIYNPNATVAYVNIYNVAAASVTVGTTTALLNLAIPAGAAANIELGKGIPFDTAISASATTTGGGNTAPTTALEVNLLFK